MMLAIITFIVMHSLHQGSKMSFNEIGSSGDNFFHNLWESIPYPCLVLSSKRVIDFVNTAAENSFQTSFDRIVDRPLDKFFGTNSVVGTILEQAFFQRGLVVVYEVEIFWLNKIKIDCNIYAAPVANSANKTLLLLHPKGNTEKMERNLLHQSAARSISGLATMLAHELRNPLAGISGAAQLLAMNSNVEDRKLTELIVSETTRIADLVTKFEVFGDQASTIKEAINIHDVLNKAKLSAMNGFASHVRIVEDYDPSLPLVLGNFNKLMQVFLNLLKNSAEASLKSNAQLKITTSFKLGLKLVLNENYSESLPIVISVKDNGFGIDQSLISSIFEPFVSSKKSGTGLGLSLVSAIISDHGGVIECNVDEDWTEFIIRLPFARNPKTHITSTKVEIGSVFKELKENTAGVAEKNRKQF